MNNNELKTLFNQQASTYDNQWGRLAAINECLYLLLESVFSELPAKARVLCVGVGTGKELIHFAKRFPLWTFTAVEPASGMLNECRKKVEQAGFSSRCYFHEGYLDSLPVTEGYDAATSFLVSQFILDKQTRSDFFREISNRLKPTGILANSDLSGEIGSDCYEAMLRAWLNMMTQSGITDDGLNRMRAAYAKDVAMLPSPTIGSIIESGGFDTPVQFFQAGLIHAWFSKNTVSNTA